MRRAKGRILAVMNPQLLCYLFYAPVWPRPKREPLMVEVPTLLMRVTEAGLLN